MCVHNVRLGLVWGLGSSAIAIQKTCPQKAMTGSRFGKAVLVRGHSLNEACLKGTFDTTPYAVALKD